MVTTKIGNALDFLTFFEGMPEPRQRAKVLYPLSEPLLCCLVGVICGANGWVEIEEYCEAKLGFLRRFLPFEQGIASHYTFSDVFNALDREAFASAFIAWAGALQENIREIIAIDGKTLRRSFDRARGRGAIHMISAWASGQRLVLGQMNVDAKTNEITAIPELLALLSLKGAIVTVDAIGYQKKIAKVIRSAGADYLLALKQNQETLSSSWRNSAPAASPTAPPDAGRPWRPPMPTMAGSRYGTIGSLTTSNGSRNATQNGSISPASPWSNLLSRRPAARHPAKPAITLHLYEPTPMNSPPRPVSTGVSGAAFITSWTSSSVRMTAVSAAKTVQLTSQPFDTLPLTCSREPKLPRKKASASNAASQPSATNSSPRFSPPRDGFKRFPCVRQPVEAAAGRVDRRDRWFVGFVPVDHQTNHLLKLEPPADQFCGSLSGRYGDDMLHGLHAFGGIAH